MNSSLLMILLFNIICFGTSCNVTKITCEALQRELNECSRDVEHWKDRYHMANQNRSKDLLECDAQIRHYMSILKLKEEVFKKYVSENVKARENLRKEMRLLKHVTKCEEPLESSSAFLNISDVEDGNEGLHIKIKNLKSIIYTLRKEKKKLKHKIKLQKQKLVPTASTGGSFYPLRVGVTYITTYNMILTACCLKNHIFQNY